MKNTLRLDDGTRIHVKGIRGTTRKPIFKKEFDMSFNDILDKEKMKGFIKVFLEDYFKQKINDEDKIVDYELIKTAIESNEDIRIESGISIYEGFDETYGTYNEPYLKLRIGFPSIEQDRIFSESNDREYPFVRIEVYFVDAIKEAIEKEYGILIRQDDCEW